MSPALAPRTKRGKRGQKGRFAFEPPRFTASRFSAFKPGGVGVGEITGRLKAPQAQSSRLSVFCFFASPFCCFVLYCPAETALLFPVSEPACLPPSPVWPRQGFL